MILEIFISFYKVMMCWVVGKTPPFPPASSSIPQTPLRPSNPLARAAPPLGPPPVPREILIHRSRGCSSNPPADAPSLLPRQPALCPPYPSLTPHTHPELPPLQPPPLGSVCLSIRLSICLSKPPLCVQNILIFSEAREKKKKKQQKKLVIIVVCKKNVFFFLKNEKKGWWKAICCHELLISWRGAVATLADEWLMATCCHRQSFLAGVGSDWTSTAIGWRVRRILKRPMLLLAANLRLLIGLWHKGKLHFFCSCCCCGVCVFFSSPFSIDCRFCNFNIPQTPRWNTLVGPNIAV